MDLICGCGNKYNWDPLYTCWKCNVAITKDEYDSLRSRLSLADKVVEAARECNERCPAGAPQWTYNHGHEKVRDALSAHDAALKEVK